MASLPSKFKYLNEIGVLPKVVRAALGYYGLKEVIGKANNPIIMQWAKDLGLEKIYTADSIAWCGLSQSIWVKEAGYTPVKDPLWALNWKNFGTSIAKKDAMLGDVLTFKRKGGGHVGLYVGESATTFFVLGGNQSDSVSITEIKKDRLQSVSRCPWSIAQPQSVKKYIISSTGKVSTNES